MTLAVAQHSPIQRSNPAAKVAYLWVLIEMVGESWDPAHQVLAAVIVILIALKTPGQDFLVTAMVVEACPEVIDVEVP